MDIPDFITHYYLPDRQPFLTLSELDQNKDSYIFQNLNERYKNDSGYQRRYGKNYINTRRQIEATLLALFIKRGGKPTRKYPFYFVLGQSTWFKHLIEEQLEIKIQLCNLNPATTSSTYSDSYIALSKNEKPYYGKVFLIHELESVIDRYGMPIDDVSLDYQGYWKNDFEKYIEFQIWEDNIIQPFLT